jgi:hypothetical protein
LKPPLIVVVMVEVPWLPCPMVSEEGEAEMVKLPLALNGNVNSMRPRRQRHSATRLIGNKEPMACSSSVVH